MLGERVDLPPIRAGRCGPPLDLREHLVGEAGAHHEGRAAGCITDLRPKAKSADARVHHESVLPELPSALRSISGSSWAGYCHRRDRMPESRTVQVPLQPGQTLSIRGRQWVVDALRTSQNGEVHVQVTWRGDRQSETVLWPYDDMRGRMAPRV